MLDQELQTGRTNSAASSGSCLLGVMARQIRSTPVRRSTHSSSQLCRSQNSPARDLNRQRFTALKERGYAPDFKTLRGETW